MKSKTLSRIAFLSTIVVCLLGTDFTFAQIVGDGVGGPPAAGTGKIVVVKAVNGGNGTFGFDVSGPHSVFFEIDTSVSDTKNLNNIPPGLYSISEMAPPDFAFDSASCDGGNPTETGNGLENIQLNADQTITCTFTNSKEGILGVNKIANGGTGTFQFTVNGTDQQGNGFGPYSFSLTTGANGLASLQPPLGLWAGNYQIFETGLPPEWTATSALCEKNGQQIGNQFIDGVDNINIGPGEAITCTFENTKQGKILTDKVTNPPGSSQSFEFNPSWSDQNFSLTDQTIPHDSGFISPGNYSVVEAIPNGWTIDSTACSDGSPVSNISLQAGEIINCTFNNRQTTSGGGLSCNSSNQCVSGGGGASCSTNSDCTSGSPGGGDPGGGDPGSGGLSCNSSNQCVSGGGGASCSTNSDCTGGDPGGGDPGGGDPGSGGLSCNSSNQCVSGGGGASCSTNSDCTSGSPGGGDPGGGDPGGGDPGSGGLSCNSSNQCVSGGGGASCSTNSDCTSGSPGGGDPGGGDPGGGDPGSGGLSCNSSNQCVSGGGGASCSTNSDCTSGSPGGGDPGGGGLTGSLTIFKNAINGDNTFEVTVNGPFFGPFTDKIETTSGDGSVFISDLTPGDYFVDEAPPSGWELVDNGCDPSVSVKSNSASQCTITNKLITQADPGKAILMICKKAVNGDGATPFNFSASPTFAIPSITPPVNGAACNEEVQLDPDDYTITEASAPTGWQFDGVDCGVASGQSTTVTLLDGDSIVCTFTNSRPVDNGEDGEGNEGDGGEEPSTPSLPPDFYFDVDIPEPDVHF